MWVSVLDRALVHRALFGADNVQRGIFRVEVRAHPRRHPADERLHEEGRYKAAWKTEFKLPWRKAGPLKSSR